MLKIMLKILDYFVLLVPTGQIKNIHTHNSPSMALNISSSQVFCQILMKIISFEIKVDLNDLRKFIVDHCKENPESYHFLNEHLEELIFVFLGTGFTDMNTIRRLCELPAFILNELGPLETTNTISDEASRDLHSPLVDSEPDDDDDGPPPLLEPEDFVDVPSEEEGSSNGTIVQVGRKEGGLIVIDFSVCFQTLSE